jgi:hypothetical protein
MLFLYLYQPFWENICDYYEFHCLDMFICVCVSYWGYEYIWTAGISFHGCVDKMNMLICIWILVWLIRFLCMFSWNWYLLVIVMTMVVCFFMYIWTSPIMFCFVTLFLLCLYIFWRFKTTFVIPLGLFLSFTWAYDGVPEITLWTSVLWCFCLYTVIVFSYQVESTYLINFMVGNGIMLHLVIRYRCICIFGDTLHLY